jgi:hypothetical protein
MNRKRMSWILSLAAVVVLASLGWLVSLSRTSQAAPAPSADAAFKGKVLLVNTSGYQPFLLEKAQVQRIGDHPWLTGKGVAEGRMGGWYKGRTVWLRMEHVVSITEFDDVKEAKKAMQSGGGMPFGGYGVPVAGPDGDAPATTPVPAPPAPAVAPPAPAR